MAPELLVPEYKMGVDGYKCDVYSVAIMFAEITIPHCDAYEGMWNFRIVEAVMKEGLRPPLPDNLPGGTSKVCMFVFCVRVETINLTAPSPAALYGDYNSLHCFCLTHHS